MFNRLFAISGLVFAAFIASTGVSAAFLDDREEVMWTTGGIVVVFVVLASIFAGIKHALGLDKMAPAPANEEALYGIRSSGFGEAAFDAAHGHSPANGHDAHSNGGHGDAHAAPVAAHTHAAHATAVAEGPYGAGSAAATADGSAPAGHDIKGNADSMLFHTPASPYYEATEAEAWFASEDAARAAGFTRWDEN